MLSFTHVTNIFIVTRFVSESLIEASLISFSGIVDRLVKLIRRCSLAINKYARGNGRAGRQWWAYGGKYGMQGVPFTLFSGIQ